MYIFKYVSPRQGVRPVPSLLWTAGKDRINLATDVHKSVALTTDVHKSVALAMAVHKFVALVMDVHKSVALTMDVYKSVALKWLYISLLL